MKTWILTHGKDGWSVVVYKQPAWRVAVSNFWEWLIPSWLCCNRFWYLHRFGWWDKPAFLDDYRQGLHWCISVTEEVAAELQPEFVADVKSWDEEE